MSPPCNLRPVVVVCGASSGIGRAIAKVAALDGHAVVLVARSQVDLDATAAMIRDSGGEAVAISLDLREPGAQAALREFLSQRGLYCDVLVNSAGYGLRGAGVKLPLDDQLGMVDLNIRSVAALTLAFLPEMVARRRGGVLNLSSVAGFLPGPYMALYYASKSFVNHFSLALHQEVRGAGVTVTCVAPGPVSTGFLQKAGSQQSRLFHIFPMLDADGVAERAWRGFKAGNRLVVPGLAAKVAILLARVLPSAAILRLVGDLQLSGNDPCPCGSGKKYKKCCGA